TGNLVQGNFIGTDATGKAPLGNAGSGVLLLNASNDTIGGTTAGARNIISANGTPSRGTAGVMIAATGPLGPADNLVQGNFIGTDATGSQPLSNIDFGVDINYGASNNVIGGASYLSGGRLAGAGNLISGNTANDASGIGIVSSDN